MFKKLKDFILCKTKKLLSEFLLPIINQTDRPRLKFFRQTVAATLLSGSLVVSEFARWVHDNCSDKFYRLNRLPKNADVFDTQAESRFATSRL